MASGSGQLAPTCPQLVQIRIRAIHVDRFLTRRLSSDQIHSLTDTQFASVVAASASVFHQEIETLDSQKWVRIMTRHKHIMGPFAPSPSGFLDGPEACTTDWIPRALCILTGHSAPCCEGLMTTPRNITYHSSIPMNKASSNMELTQQPYQGA